MLFAPVSVLLCVAGAVAAAPVEQKRWVTSLLGDVESNVEALLDFGRRNTPVQQCNMAAAEMPQASPPLPPPSKGLYLYHVAVGRGTQNYTCDTANPSAAPTAVGALASLYNSTCMAADNPTLLNLTPNIALQLPEPTSGSSDSSPASEDLSGHHYFTDLTTAYFNLDTSRADYGQGAFKKIAASPAPADAMKGPGGVGNGAVPWLKLTAKPGDTCPFQEVYRVNTAGGQPPATCQDQQAAFQVQYSAEYWFYA